MPRVTAIRKAPRPITGGMIWAPLAAMTSIDPACSRVKPPRIIVGIVIEPLSAMQLTV